jgi:hypothetical protein
MNFTSKGTREILIAGCQEQMFKLDVEKGTVVDIVGPHGMTGDGMLTQSSFQLMPNTPS